MHLSMWSLTRDVQERQEKHQGIYVNFHRNNHPKGGGFSIHNNKKHNPPFIDPLSFGDCQEIWRSCLLQWVRQQILKIYNPLFCPYVPWWGLTLIGALIVYVVTLGHRCRNRGGEATAPPTFLACPYLTMEKLHKTQHQSRFYSIPVASSEVFKLFILATGFFVFQFLYCEILEETCDGIWNVIQLEYVKTPSTKEEWKGITTQFQHLWNFPNGTFS